MSKSYSAILFSYISDHLPYFTCLHIYKSNKQKRNKHITIDKDWWRFNKIAPWWHWINFEKHSVSKWFNNESQFDIWYSWTHILLAKKHQKPEMIKSSHYKHKKNPWINKGIWHSITFRDKLYKRVRLTDPDSIKYQILHERLTAYNLILQRNINQT